ncbi:FAD-dependent oxidoreductase [Chelatococcus reniformis]|uniref:FAD-dependent oxidoreductase n=1 Tax=Chelatococcus reniformis TaxID=1494448 RepID=UPI0024584CA3|nr:FAD-dependent oxidoreductase [Chelatococcus reniformis]
MQGRLAAWWTDPLARGSYSLARPGHAAARAALGRPVAGRLIFAGEATAGPGAMTVGGATLAGTRAAQTIVQARSG